MGTATAKGKAKAGRVASSKAKAAKAKAKAAGGKAGKTKLLAVCDSLKHAPRISRDQIKYDPQWEKKGGPQHYAHVTVFIDRGNKIWRVKPCPGPAGRKETKVPFKSCISHHQKQDRWKKVQDAVLDALARPPC